MKIANLGHTKVGSEMDLASTSRSTSTSDLAERVWMLWAILEQIFTKYLKERRWKEQASG